jgi:hypothetical protein
MSKKKTAVECQRSYAVQKVREALTPLRAQLTRAVRTLQAATNCRRYADHAYTAASRAEFKNGIRENLAAADQAFTEAANEFEAARAEYARARATLQEIA